MRPRGFYVVFLAAFSVAVCHGYHEARHLSPHRAYKRFLSRHEAEEFAAWWQYSHQPPWMTNTKE